MAKKIYLIDDEKDFTELTKSLFSFNGFEVTSSNDPQEGLKAIQNGSYDAVVVDLMMPGLSGFSIIQSLRENPTYSKTPIFVMSAKKLSPEERKTLLTQETHFIPKPFEPLRLVDFVKQILLSK